MRKMLIIRHKLSSKLFYVYAYIICFYIKHKANSELIIASTQITYHIFGLKQSYEE